MPQGDLYARMTLKNVTEKAPVAFYIFTSSKERIYILPSQGFIVPGFLQTIQIAWAAADRPQDIHEAGEKLEKVIFFIKALPLAQTMDIQAMSQDLPNAFNTYNLNIMFTIYSLPAKVQMGLPPPASFSQPIPANDASTT